MTDYCPDPQTIPKTGLIGCWKDSYGRKWEAFIPENKNIPIFDGAETSMFFGYTEESLFVTCNYHFQEEHIGLVVLTSYFKLSEPPLGENWKNSVNGLGKIIGKECYDENYLYDKKDQDLNFDLKNCQFQISAQKPQIEAGFYDASLDCD
jgi:hypothetical protein